MKFIINRIAFLFVVLLSWQNVSGQQDYSMEHYLVEEGLPHNVINQIIQDRKGFIWLATFNGLSKYDGYSFKNYKTKPSDKVFMKNNRINKIIEDRYGRIWIKSNSTRSNAYCFNPEDGSFWGTDLIEETSGKGFPLSRIIAKRSGYVWLLSEQEGCILIADSLYSAKIYDKEHKNLNASTVRYVYEDRQENSWLLTNNGITMIEKNRLDKPLYFFSDPSSRTRSYFSVVELEDEIWFGGSDGIIAKYVKGSRSFRTQELEMKGEITCLEKLDEHTILAITDHKGFCTINTSTDTIQIYNTEKYPELKTRNLIPITITENNHFWFVNDREKGIFLFDFITRKLKYFASGYQGIEKQPDLKNASVYVNKKGETWVQLNGGRFFKYDPGSNTLIPFIPTSNYPAEDFTNSFHTAFFDKQGNLWFSSQSSGLTKVVFSDNNFKIRQIDKEQLRSTVKGVRCIFQKKNGNIWVSTKQNQVLIFDRDLNKIGCLSPSGTLEENSIWNRAVYSMAEDPRSNIWIGTRGDGLYRMTPLKAPFKFDVKNYKNDENEIYSLSNNDIYSIFQDKKDQIWIGTLDGVNLIEDSMPGQLRFIHYKNDWRSYPRQNFNKVRCIDMFNDLIYAGTMSGLLVFNPDSITKNSYKIKRYEVSRDTYSSLTGNDIIDICTTHTGEIYIATAGGGINKVLKTDDLGYPVSFKGFTQEDGLPSDNILALQEDIDGKIWVTTDYNLARFNPEKELFEVFPEIKWITKGQNFSEATRIKLNNNELLFGYSDGIIHFYPSQIKPNDFSPYLALTDFKLFNQKKAEKDDYPLNASVDNSRNLVLAHDQNFFNIEFAALDYKNPSNIKYAYKLEGFDKNWNYIQNQRTAMYTNVPKGSYVFRVKSTNSQGIWANNERTLPITVKPSIWNTTFFYIIYGLVFIAVILLINYTVLTIYRLKTNVKLEKRMSDIKQKFFIDISHEIRTPLTLITAPIEYLINDSRTPHSVKDQLSYVAQSSNRLLRLVNQILDFRKIQDVNIKVSEIEVSQFVRDIFNDFVEMAKEQNIAFSFDEEVGDTKIWADRNGLEKIVMNLLSNAFKYTPDGKSIKVKVTKDEKQLGIHFVDEGIGIPKDKQANLFIRFVSLNSKSNNPSTGIGLSLVKELIEKHNAKLDFTSEPHKGSSFSVYFKFGKEHFSDDVVFLSDENKQELSKNNEVVPDLSLNKSRDRIKILVVEDDMKLRTFIRNILEVDYEVVEAENGETGYQLVLHEKPDFVVSDIMMPKLDGVGLLRKIRNNIDTSHVPVILLTAKTNIESKLEGLSYGADDYITKPFSVSYFKVRIINLLNQRRRLQDIFGSIENNGFKDYNPKPCLIADLDEEIMKNVMIHIEQNMDNNNFSVENLGASVGLNRTTFYYKIKSLTGFSPVEFIRDIRLKRAAHLIINSQLLIKEVAFMTGFSDIKYFSKSFKKKYGKSPNDYRKENK